MRWSCRILLTLIVLTVGAQGDVIIDTFGPDYGVAHFAWAITQLNGGQSVGAAFMPAVDVMVTQIDTAFYSTFPINKIEIDLVEDSHGLPGGTVVQSWNISFGVIDKYIVTLPANALLHGQTQYWLTAAATDNQTDAGWYTNPLDIEGPLAFKHNNQDWYGYSAGVLPAFDVLGTPAVPEPGTLCLLGTAAMGTVGLLRRKKENSRKD